MLNYEQIIYFFNVLLLKLLRHSCTHLNYLLNYNLLFSFPTTHHQSIFSVIIPLQIKKKPHHRFGTSNVHLIIFTIFFFERKKANSELKRRKKTLIQRVQIVQASSYRNHKCFKFIFFLFHFEIIFHECWQQFINLNHNRYILKRAY